MNLITCLIERGNCLERVVLITIKRIVDKETKASFPCSHYDCLDRFERFERLTMGTLTGGCGVMANGSLEYRATFYPNDPDFCGRQNRSYMFI